MSLAVGLVNKLSKRQILSFIWRSSGRLRIYRIAADRGGSTCWTTLEVLDHFNGLATVIRVMVTTWLAQWDHGNGLAHCTVSPSSPGSPFNSKPKQLLTFTLIFQSFDIQSRQHPARNITKHITLVHRHAHSICYLCLHQVDAACTLCGTVLFAPQSMYSYVSRDSCS